MQIKPELAKEYIELVDEYHSRKIISDEAYIKISNVMENGDDKDY